MLPAMPLTRRQFLATSAVTLPILQSGSTLANPARPNAFRRGGALHAMMNWAALQDENSRQYLPRPFEAPRNAFPAAFVQDFADCGFDCIRLTMDVGPFMQLQGSDRDALEQKLLDNIRLFHDLGLAVIVDCHPVEQVRDYSVPAILDDLEGPLFAGYTAMIGRLAGLLATVRSGHVALELMNEPVMKDTPHHIQVMVWGAAQLVLHDTARRAASDLPLLLTGADYGGISGLTELDPTPYAGSNTLFSYHYYMPLSFTHQGVDFGTDDAPALAYLSDLPYPYDAISQDEITAAIEARIAAEPALDAEQKGAARDHAMRILRDFLADGWNRKRIEDDFATVSAWADRNGLPRHRIIMGECGVTRRAAGFTGAQDVYRKQWLSDVTHVAQTEGFGWILWSIDSREMGIDDINDKNRVDRSLLAALAM